jgi:hypothetical protein
MTLTPPHVKTAYSILLIMRKRNTFGFNSVLLGQEPAPESEYLCWTKKFSFLEPEKKIQEWSSFLSQTLQFLFSLCFPQQNVGDTEKAEDVNSVTQWNHLCIFSSSPFLVKGGLQEEMRRKSQEGYSECGWHPTLNCWGDLTGWEGRNLCL